MHYVGKDIVHRGAALELDPQKLESSLAHSARKNVRKAQGFGFEISRAVGTPEELSALRALWYFPEDPNFPEAIGEEDALYLARLEGELVGGMILVAVGTHYFLNNLLANDRGKAGQLQALLLWNAVHDLADSAFTYIDIGASYRPNLQRFFQKWRSFDYPILFNPPERLPQISFLPFHRLAKTSGEADDAKIRAFCQGRPYTILPSRDIALEVARDRGLEVRESTVPTPDASEVELVDLVQLLPVAHGALLVGEEIPIKDLWIDHGCYDFVKTESLGRVLSAAADDWTDLCAARLLAWQSLAAFFERDDVEVAQATAFPTTFAIRVASTEALASRYSTFGVDARVEDGVLHLPCHQELNEAEIEYVYAIYRGHLNLCSAWTPTGVRGRLTVGT